MVKTQNVLYIRCHNSLDYERNTFFIKNKPCAFSGSIDALSFKTFHHSCLALFCNLMRWLWKRQNEVLWH